MNTPTVLLAGAGHTHALIIAGMARRSWPNARIVCVSPSAIGTYSGMLPGVLAGQYRRSQMAFDVARLCRRARVAFIEDEVVAVDADRRIAVLGRGTRVTYDVASINLGSGPGSTPGAGEAPVIDIRPMTTFLDRLAGQWRAVHARTPVPHRHVRIVGGGLAAVELALTIPLYVGRLTPGVRLDISIETRSGDVARHASAETRARIRHALAERDVQVVLTRNIVRDGSVDLVVRATGAAPPRRSAEMGVITNDTGYLVVDASLRTSSRHVFAAGDAAAFTMPSGRPLPKAGVYAVRQAPTLEHNLRAALEGRPLRVFRPQHSFLTLINTGDGRAIGEWRGKSVEGAWVWKLKDHIDRRFMRRITVSAEGTV
ncbi:MAG: FAD-dependent oxidoreductase [Vicinamibacterales bacterium]